MKFIDKIKRTIEFWYFQRRFSSNFNFYTTIDKNEINEIYRIRYQVYCVEYGYLNKDNYSDEKEHDEYDDKSIHFILRHKKTKIIAATVRLILNSDSKFPIEKYFKLDIYKSNKDSRRLAEVSRLIVSRRFRKKYLLLALLKGMFVYAKYSGITHVYCVMDDKLYQILINIGFPFHQIGPATIYQGITKPYILDLSEMLENLKSNNQPLYKYLLNGTINYNDFKQNYTIY